MVVTISAAQYDPYAGHIQARGSARGVRKRVMRQLSEMIRQEALRLGFDLAGIAEVRPSDHAAFYRAWLEAGNHGDFGCPTAQFRPYAGSGKGEESF